MRHYESVGDDESLGLVLIALVRGRKPWMMDLRFKRLKPAKLERFSEVLLVLFRWVMRNAPMSVDDVRKFLKKIEQYLRGKERQAQVTQFLHRFLEDRGRISDAYDVVRMTSDRQDWMGLTRKRQMQQTLGRTAADLYKRIDPATLTRTGGNPEGMLKDALRHLEKAVKDRPEDTASRIHLVELLMAKGDDTAALDASKDPSSDDYDAQAQRIVLLLRELTNLECFSDREETNREKDRRKDRRKDRNQKVAEVVDEVLECCDNLLSLDPSAREPVSLLVKLHDMELMESRHAERLVAMLSDVFFDEFDGCDGQCNADTESPSLSTKVNQLISSFEAL